MGVTHCGLCPPVHSIYSTSENDRLTKNEVAVAFLVFACVAMTRRLNQKADEDTRRREWRQAPNLR